MLHECCCTRQQTVVRRYGSMARRIETVCACGCGSRVKRRTQAYLPHHNRLTDEERFWQKVDRRGCDDCWLWLGATTGDRRGYGHGRLSVDGRLMVATRFIWERILGREIEQGQYVLHTCDVPQCVNPRHLQLGTLSDNAVQMYKRGRGPDNRGECHGEAKLTAADVSRIRRRRERGVSYKQIAETFGISQALVWSVTRGAGWKHVGSGQRRQLGLQNPQT